MRVTVPSAVLATQAAPAPTATSPGSASDRDRVAHRAGASSGSRRVTVSVRAARHPDRALAGRDPARVGDLAPAPARGSPRLRVDPGHGVVAARDPDGALADRDRLRTGADRDRPPGRATASDGSSSITAAAGVVDHPHAARRRPRPPPGCRRPHRPLRPSGAAAPGLRPPRHPHPATATRERERGNQPATRASGPRAGRLAAVEAARLIHFRVRARNAGYVGKGGTDQPPALLDRHFLVPRASDSSTEKGVPGRCRSRHTEASRSWSPRLPPRRSRFRSGSARATARRRTSRSIQRPTTPTSTRSRPRTRRTR